MTFSWPATKRLTELCTNFAFTLKTLPSSITWPFVESTIHRNLTKRGREEMADRDVGEEEEKIVEGRLAKRIRAKKDVGKEKEVVPTLHKPEDLEELK